ncbi:MAG: GWxTD domain-containing protein [Clostridiales bacterium]|nr:GWxTD domain-containing protein [Clostridiales bacterium]
MKKRSIYFLCFLFLGAAIVFPFPQKQKSPKDLPRQHRKWLEEEVVYIITAKEKDIFLQLETDREREIFIEAFWKVRDPDPNTPENEFKVEHYRRINYANQWLGREGPGQGWRSDMGRIYILLGEPQHIDRFENLAEIYPFVIWFYQGMAKYGLPDSFYVAFFKKSGTGEFELYSPVKYGPQSLLIHYKGDAADHLSAYYELQDVDPTIAEVSMSLIPGEHGQILSPSLASEVLIASKIPSAPQQQVKDAYAEKLLAYKDIIEVDYTANYIESDASAEILLDKSGFAWAHYLIEPQRLTLEQVGNRFRANLEVNGKVSDHEGNTIFQYDRTVPIDFDREQLSNIKAKLFSFQDMFPLIEGDYKLNILLKNTVSKEFTSVEKDLTVASPSAFRIGRLVLANRIIRNSEYRGKNKPFLIGDLQLVPSPRNDFSQQDTLYVYFQITGLTPELRESGTLEYAILKEGNPAFLTARPVREYPDRMNFLEEFPLASLASGFYKIKVSLRDASKNEILFEQSDFSITVLPSLPRPWVLSIPQPPSENPIYANILGNQFLNKKIPEKARLLLAEAYRKNPAMKKFALDYCRILFADKDYRKVKEVASSFLKSQDRFEFLALLGQSSQALGELAEAIAYYKDYLAHYGANINILNAIGLCYYQLGNLEEALIALEKSLEISPGQENIKKMINAIKEKK